VKPGVVGVLKSLWLLLFAVALSGTLVMFGLEGLSRGLLHRTHTLRQLAWGVMVYVVSLYGVAYASGRWSRFSGIHVDVLGLVVGCAALVLNDRGGGPRMIEPAVAMFMFSCVLSIRFRQKLRGAALG
jgi:hypothetical protein